MVDFYDVEIPQGNKVILKEVEICTVCGGRFFSLYPLTLCIEHDNLDGTNRERRQNGTKIYSIHQR